MVIHVNCFCGCKRSYLDQEIIIDGFGEYISIDLCYHTISNYKYCFLQFFLLFDQLLLSHHFASLMSDLWLFLLKHRLQHTDLFYQTYSVIFLARVEFSSSISVTSVWNAVGTFITFFTKYNSHLFYIIILSFYILLCHKEMRPFLKK